MLPLHMLRPHRPSNITIPSLQRSTRGILTLRQQRPKECQTHDEAVQAIKSGNLIFVHGIAAIPDKFLQAIANRASSLDQVSFCHLHLEKPNPCDAPRFQGKFFTHHFFIGGVSRKGVAEGRGAYVPCFLSEVPRIMRKKGGLNPDVALLNVSPPDKHGYCSLGTEVAAAFPAAQMAKTIIAQVNPSMPRTFGSSAIHISSIDYIVNFDQPLPSKHITTASDVEEQIGKNIAALVPDGACLQMGIGAIPNAVLRQLFNHKNLGIHTEMFEEGAIDLIESGAITNFNKQFLPGKLVTSFIMGTQRVYDFVDDNPTVEFYDSEITNDPRIIGRNKNVVAINSAVEIDLTGQVCADSVGTRMISGVGGQVDFERGAALSEGGVPIIALSSRSKNGQPRIVPFLQQGAGIVTSRAHTHYIVTEHGAVDLFGKNMMERAKALISIAHPDDREGLTEAARKRFGQAYAVGGYSMGR